jgi:hypothetical protein
VNGALGQALICCGSSAASAAVNCARQADGKKSDSLKSLQLDSLKNIAGILDIEVSGTKVLITHDSTCPVRLLND